MLGADIAIAELVGDRNRLIIKQAAVGSPHDHVIDVVRADIGRCLEVGRGDKG